MDPFFGFEYEQEWVPDNSGTVLEQEFASAANVHELSEQGLPVQSLQPRSLLGPHDSEELSITKV